jgi:hypothetical protein
MITILVFVLVLSTSFFVFPFSKARAQGGNPDICKAETQVWDQNLRIYPLDMRTTANNWFKANIVSLADKASGDNSEELIKCGTHGVKGTVAAEPILRITGDCGTPKPGFCEALNNTYNPAETGTLIYDPMAESEERTLAYKAASGSLMGIAARLERASYEPVPANLAYYFNREMSDVPFMGQAFAQSAADYSGPLMKITYDLWVISRNAALGAIAVIMIIVGIAIMTRRKINPQTAVTAQYALPRVVIALFLIMFSYPIGAALASFSWALRHSGESIIFSIASSAGSLVNLEMAAALVGAGFGTNVALALALSFIPGAAFTIFGIALIGLLIVLVLWVLVEIKMFTIYLRFIIHIITAPIIFTYGAVPGKEDATVNWFKKAAVYILSLFAMSAAIAITRLIAAALMIELSSSFAGFAISVIFVPLIVFFIYSYGFMQTRRLPSKIEDAIMGPKKR